MAKRLRDSYEGQRVLVNTLNGAGFLGSAVAVDETGWRLVSTALDAVQVIEDGKEPVETPEVFIPADVVWFVQPVPS